MYNLELRIQHRDGAARAGSFTTAHGVVRTPAFMPVGTRGTIRSLTMFELERLEQWGAGADVVLGNTYHLMLRPGAETVAALGGLHRFSGWSGSMLTDSGGYQVFSLDPSVDDEGVTFKSTYDGSIVRFTPDDAVHTQEALGADIAMVLDVCAALPSPPEVLRLALERTAAWAERQRTTHGRADQALFGICQGGVDPVLRQESARRTAALDFDGYAVGGLSVGEPRHQMLPALEAAVAHLPEDRPRYLMGVGDPVSIVESVARGIDMFDCVLPTRLGRHGTLLTGTGRLNIKRAEFGSSTDPVDADCPCPVCTRLERGYLRHLFAVGEATGPALATLHNLSWMGRFTAAIRAAIAAGTLDELRRHVGSVWP